MNHQLTTAVLSELTFPAAPAPAPLPRPVGTDDKLPILLKQPRNPLCPEAIDLPAEVNEDFLETEAPSYNPSSPRKLSDLLSPPPPSSKA